MVDRSADQASEAPETGSASGENWIRVLPLVDLSEGSVHRSIAGDMDIVLCRIGDVVHAVKNECTHQQVFLHRGWIGQGPDGRCALVCPAHGAKFDPVTGAALVGPAARSLQTYEVEVRAGEVWVRKGTTTDSRSETR